DSDGGLVKDDIDAFHHLPDEFYVPHIAIDKGYLARRKGGFEILPAPSSKVIQNDNFLITFGNQPIGDIGAGLIGSHIAERYVAEGYPARQFPDNLRQPTVRTYVSRLI